MATRVAKSFPGTLVVRTRDLQTGADSRIDVSVEVPGDDAGMRAQMTARVAALDPEARLRTFGDGAATFIARGRMLIAHYENVAREPLVMPARDHAHEQGELFVA